MYVETEAKAAIFKSPKVSKFAWVVGLLGTNMRVC